MKHAQRMVVLTEDEYTKLKALNDEVKHSDQKTSKNPQLDKIIRTKATENNSGRTSSHNNISNQCNQVEDNNRKTGLSISKTIRNNNRYRRRRDESKSDLSGVSRSRHNNKNKKSSSEKKGKQRHKNAKEIAKRLLWIKNDVSRKIKENLLDGVRDIDDSGDIIAPPVQRSIAIQSYFKPQYKSLVSAIVSGLKQIGVKFKDNYEVQLPYGERIEGSNIVHLLKELVTGSKMTARRPIGWKLFLPLVAQTNTPLLMFTKLYVRNRIEKIRSDQPWEEY